MALFCNLFRDGTSLLEPQAQGDATIPVALHPDHVAELEALLVSPEASAALAGLFLAGVTVGERSAHVNGVAAPR